MWSGSLINLAKHPSSTVQILGAEKALFRALKTKHDTPKYGLIYHASLVGQTNPKNKGKMSRMLAAKASLAIRVDALGEGENHALGMEHRAKLESRLRSLEEGGKRKFAGSGKATPTWEKYSNKSEVKTYDPAADSTLPAVPKKRKHSETDEEDSKAKKIKVEPQEDTPKGEKKKKKKDKKRDSTAMDDTLNTTLDTTQEVASPESSKKKKKKKKVKEEPESD